MINVSIGRSMVIPLVWFSFLNGQLVVEIKKGVFDPHTACCMKLIENAIYWKDRGNLLLARECLQISLCCLESMAHDAVLGGDEEKLEYSRETLKDVEYYMKEVEEELRLIHSDIYDPIKSVSPEKKQRLVRSLEYMEQVGKFFWEEWRGKSRNIDFPKKPLISNRTEKEFILHELPCKGKKRGASDISPSDVCDCASEINGGNVSNKKRKTDI